MAEFKKHCGVLILLVSTLWITACSPQKQDDCGYVQNIYGQRISWKSKAAIPIYIHSSVPVNLKPAIYRAAATWEMQAGRKVFEISDDSSKLSATPTRDQKNGIYFLSDWESDSSSEQGRTSVFWAGDEIQEADIRINGADFSFYDKNPSLLVGSLRRAKSESNSMTPVDGYSFEALMVHELGHFLGLKHREDAGTVMATHLAAFTNRTQLSGTDQGALSCEYK